MWESHGNVVCVLRYTNSPNSPKSLPESVGVDISLFHCGSELFNHPGPVWQG